MLNNGVAVVMADASVPVAVRALSSASRRLHTNRQHLACIAV
jgi:hypothetical protein